VFKAGRFFFEDGLRALAKAKAAGCPVVFVSNGGAGLQEGEYLNSLKEKITHAASPADQAAHGPALAGLGVDSMILSYTPMGEDERFRPPGQLLLVGDPKEKVKACADAYGWSYVHVSDYCADHPGVDPFKEAMRSGTSHTAVANPNGDRPSASSKGDFATSAAAGKDNFDTVVVMSDPHDWFEALQVAAVSGLHASVVTGVPVVTRERWRFVTVFIFKPFLSCVCVCVC